jgi:hypothetical protein
MVCRIVSGPVAIPTRELHTTSSVARGHVARFLVPYVRTSTYRPSFFPDSIRIWNSLPQPLVDSTSLDAFKQDFMSDIMASFILFHYRNLILAKNEELLIYHLHISYFDFTGVISL